MRVYNKWAGNPKGDREDPKCCVAEVAEGGRSCLFHQCFKPRGKDPGELYCGIHANQISKGRNIWTPDDKEK